LSFSVVLITFTLVIIQTVGLVNMFIPFYLTVIFAGFIAALIMPRIPPLSRISNTYIEGVEPQGDETIPEGYNLLTYGYEKALNRDKKEQSNGGFFKRGAQNVLDMWMG